VGSLQSLHAQSVQEAEPANDVRPAAQYVHWNEQQKRMSPDEISCVCVGEGTREEKVVLEGSRVVFFGKKSKSNR
jgi:hypothetical protein